MVDAEQFYDGLAGDYDLLFDDWWTAARWHGQVICEVLASQGVLPPARLLDCTCGIGTQALPLSAAGFDVTGTDVSAAAVTRARSEAAARDLQLALHVADVRRLHDAVRGTFDVVLSCDNALPHLLTDEDLATALRSLRACLRDGGLLLASLRDYDALAAERCAGVPIALHGEPGTRHGAGQSWSWSDDGEQVAITLFTLAEENGGWRAAAHETTYRALRRDTLTGALHAAGFTDVHWLTPEQSGYYQPLVLAT